jgi:hypothetical protein
VSGAGLGRVGRHALGGRILRWPLGGRGCLFGTLRGGARRLRREGGRAASRGLRGTLLQGQQAAFEDLDDLHAVGVPLLLIQELAHAPLVQGPDPGLDRA